MTKKEAQRNAVLNGGRGSGRTIRLIYEIIADLKKENRLLGERCNQLLKDKGDLTDKIADLKANFDYVLEGKDVEIMELKETLAQTIENDEVTYETLKLHDQEEIEMLKSRVAELEQQIEKMKCCYNCKHWQNESWYGVCQLEQIDCSDYKCWELKE